MTPRRIVLPVLIGLFVTSATLKAVSGIGGAMAQIPMSTTVAPQLSASRTDPPESVAQAEAAGVTGGAPPADWIPDLVVDLRRREEALLVAQADVDRREDALRHAETRIAEQIAALDAAEQALLATMALADRAAETDLQRLTSVFEAMRPEQAATVVAEMAPDFAAGLIARLRPETAAAIFSGLEPRLAYALSAILAGRNAEVPRR